MRKHFRAGAERKQFFMTYKKLLAFVLLMLLLAAISVQAQEASARVNQDVSPEKLALIKELIELASSKQTIDAMLKAQSEQMEQRLPEIVWQAVSGMKELKTLTPAQTEALKLQVLSSSARTGRRMYDLLMQKIDFEKLIVDISVPLHDKYFTEAELRDLVAFYKSPTGRKVIAVMPSLVVESMTRASDIIMPKVAEMMSQLQQEETELVTKEIEATVKAKQKATKPTGRATSRRPRP
jgi:hypothetical protein